MLYLNCNWLLLQLFAFKTNGSKSTEHLQPLDLIQLVVLSSLFCNLFISDRHHRVDEHAIDVRLIYVEDLTINECNEEILSALNREAELSIRVFRILPLGCRKCQRKTFTVVVEKVI